MVLLSGCGNNSTKETEIGLLDNTIAQTIETTENVTKEKEEMSPPIIELIGADTVELVIGELYSDEGVKTSNKKDGELNVSIEDNINYLKKGVYEITYTVIDEDGNSLQKKREIVINPIVILTENEITTIIEEIEPPFESAGQNFALAFKLTIMNNSIDTIEVPPMFIFENKDIDEHEFNSKVITQFPIDKLKSGETTTELLKFVYEDNQDDLMNSQKIKFNYSSDGTYTEFPYEINIRIADFVGDAR
jgi:hypothetical protein